MESIELASDASFVDNQDRRSSAGYICQVYGGLVDWKATKQPTVTTSTTETRRARYSGGSDSSTEFHSNRIIRSPRDVIISKLSLC